MKRSTQFTGLFLAISVVGTIAACSTSTTDSVVTGSEGVESEDATSCNVCATNSKALKKTCNSCTEAVCAEDPYCCKTKWNQQCVDEVAEYCAVSTCGGSGGGSPTGAGGSAPTTGSGGSSPTTSTSTSTSTTTGGGGGGGGAVTPPTMPSPTIPAIQVENLLVGVFGDVRPANPDQTASYPDSILGGIFSGLQAMNVPVTVDVGDHCFEAASTAGGTCHDQMVNHFMAQRASYSGKLLPTMGNHEGCAADAATAGNCAAAPYTKYILQDFLTDVVGPSTGQSSSPWYSVVLYGPWGTAKFIHIAANAWDTAGKQSAWVQASLAVPTTYTFTVRHEPSNDTRALGVTPTESMISSAHSGGSLTLSLTGHSHFIQLPGGTQPYGDSYGATQAYEVIIGNGGAPLDAGPAYGFAVLQRRASDGAVVMQAYQVQDKSGNALSNVADTSFRFAVNANGTSNSDTSLP